MTDGDRQIYRGRLISLAIENVALPDGRRVELEIVRHPGGAVIVALDASNQVCLLRQFRFAAGGMIWELPAGCIDKEDISPLNTAQRELREEAGVLAEQWTDLGRTHPSPGFCDEVLHLYLARGLTLVDTRQEDDEHIEVHWLPLDKAIEMAATGEISDAKTVIGLFRSKNQSSGGGPPT